MPDYIRIACAVPPVRVGDVQKNAEDICAYIEKADAQNADILVLPELALTGYTCGDLFFQETLHKAVKDGLRKIADCSGKHPNLAIVVGLPLKVGTKLYNCAAVLSRGEVAGIVPKTHIPNQGEFSEKRWFASGKELEDVWLEPGDIGLIASEDYWSVPVKCKQLFYVGCDAVVGIEICADLFAPVPVSCDLALNGAEVILNLSASNERAGKRAFRKNAAQHQSAACCCIYAMVSSGCTESTTDLVFSGHSLVAENGTVLQENAGYAATDYMLVQDCDLGKIRADRCMSQCFGSAEDSGKNRYSTRSLYGDHLRSDGTRYPVRKYPFIPEGAAQRDERCAEIFAIQVAGLKQRLSLLGCKAVVGISGGLDSALALLVAVEAMHQLGRPATDVHGVTMPCFGTTERTYANSLALMRGLGVTCKEIPIRDSVMQHFRDLEHDPDIRNATYENAQARERTQVLMDYASVVNGIVVGTGDLSELALGWCTYNGDHMSMYGVNASVPKTLISHIIRWAARQARFVQCGEVLQSVLDTPISPELLPPDETGMICQQTEDIVGPYALHDFFLYHMLRFGFAPAKIYHLACRVFSDEYDGETVKKWLRVFYSRFFTQQFKRNCLPDGAKVGSVSLSPRGDWRMPADASARLWLEEVENL